MNSCMVKHATLMMQDEAREEWFASMEARRAERREAEKKQEEAAEFNKEWWRRDE